LALVRGGAAGNGNHCPNCYLRRPSTDFRLVQPSPRSAPVLPQSPNIFGFASHPA
jgi:hypothetical protein